MASCADTGPLSRFDCSQNLITPQPAACHRKHQLRQCETVTERRQCCYNSAYQQAVTQGVSVFVASVIAARLAATMRADATHASVSCFRLHAYNVAVGAPTSAIASPVPILPTGVPANTPAFGSAISYAPEIPWNDSCAGALVSNYLGFSPTYGPTSLCNDPLSAFLGKHGGRRRRPQRLCHQEHLRLQTAVLSAGLARGWPSLLASVLGNPSDGVRDTPDVSLFSADGLWSHFYIFCWSNTAQGGASCGGGPSTWSGAGGTSFASPHHGGHPGAHKPEGWRPPGQSQPCLLST